MTKKEILKIFKDTKAFKEGHFLLSSGLHSSGYIQAALVLQYPHLAKRLCRELAKKFESCKIDVVVSPAIGGIIVGHEVAGFFKVRAIYAERENGKMHLRRSFNLNKGERILLVENIVTTGSSLCEVIELIKKSGAKLVGVGSLVNRGKRDLILGEKKVKALLNLDISSYKKEECPLCKKNIPFYAQGSRWIKK